MAQRDGMRPVAVATLVVLASAGRGRRGQPRSPTPRFFNGLHVALATLVWSGVLATALLTLPRADREPELSRLEVDRTSA